MTQAQTVLWHMEHTGPITSDEAWRLYRITRLAARIGDLKRKGYTVFLNRVTSGACPACGRSVYGTWK